MKKTLERDILCVVSSIPQLILWLGLKVMWVVLLAKTCSCPISLRKITCLTRGIAAMNIWQATRVFFGSFKVTSTWFSQVENTDLCPGPNFQVDTGHVTLYFMSSKKTQLWYTELFTEKSSWEGYYEYGEWTAQITTLVKCRSSVRGTLATSFKIPCFFQETHLFNHRPCCNE